MKIRISVAARAGVFRVRATALAAVLTGGLAWMNVANAGANTFDDLKWVPATESPIEIRGLPFFGQNHGNWWRFPETDSGMVPSYVWETSKCSTGARLRFRTDAIQVAVRMAWQNCATNDNLSKFGAASLDVYVDGQYLRSVVPEELGERTEWIFNGLSKRERDICLYLPLFSVVTVHAVGFDRDAQILRSPPFCVDKPIVFYGTSITHGGCAARAGLSYGAMLGRRLNADFVNFGLNGCGRGEAEVAKILADVDASCYVLDFAQNNEGPDSLRANYLPLIDTIRAKHPQTPILCVTPIYWVAELPGSEVGSIHEKMRQVIRDAVQECKARGDTNTHLVEGNVDLLNETQGDGLTDGLHPNTFGFRLIANGLEPHLRKALGLAPAP